MADRESITYIVVGCCLVRVMEAYIRRPRVVQFVQVFFRVATVWQIE